MRPPVWSLMMNAITMNASNTATAMDVTGLTINEDTGP